MSQLRILALVDDSTPAARYRLTRSLFLRGLALVYLAAFGSLAVQLDGLIGSQGILPAAEFLDRTGRLFGRGPQATGDCRRSSGSMRRTGRSTRFAGAASCSAWLLARRDLARRLRGAPLGVLSVIRGGRARCFWATSGTRCCWKPACWRC